MVWYADTSALVKLVLPEAESSGLRSWLALTNRRIATAELTITELLRAVTRADVAVLPAARAIFTGVDVHLLDRADFERAGMLGPIELRSLDAIHLVAAQNVGRTLEGILTYDTRMAAAATALGMTVVAPT